MDAARRADLGFTAAVIVTAAVDEDVRAPVEAPVTEVPVTEVPPSLSVDRAHPQGLQHRP